jgi:hypothetical protein
MDQSQYNIQYNRMITDIKDNPGPTSGKYNNIKYHLKCPNGTNWNGYISIPFHELTEDIQAQIEDNTSCKIIGNIIINDENYIEFDINSGGGIYYVDFFDPDIIIRISEDNYKDCDYVKMIIYRIIDTYIDSIFLIPD